MCYSVYSFLVSTSRFKTFMERKHGCFELILSISRRKNIDDVSLEL